MTHPVSIQHLRDDTFAVRVMAPDGTLTGHVSRQELEAALSMAPGKVYTQSSALPESYPVHKLGTRVHYAYDVHMTGVISARMAGLYSVRWDSDPREVAHGYTYSMLTPISEEAPDA